MEPISFANAGEQLEGTLFMPTEGKAPFAGVIFFHGMTSSQKSYMPMAQALAEHGIAAMTVNIRGHGGSGGVIETLTAKDFESDGIAAYDFFVKQTVIDANRIGICGGSFGALLAAMISEVRDVKSVVLRAPAAYSQSMREEPMGDIIKREARVFNDLPHVELAPAIQAIKKFKGSVLVVASENDHTIPLSMARAYHDNATAAVRREFEILNGAEHSLQNDEVRKRFTDRIVEWFLQTL